MAEYVPCQPHHVFPAQAVSDPPHADDVRCECGAITVGEAMERARKHRAERGLCAECRFWKDDDLRKRFYGELPMSNLPGEWKECTRVYENDARLSVAAIHAEDDAPMTRSDFGCVQWERKP